MIRQNNNDNWNKYFYPNTNTLINKFNIYDHDLAKEKEEEESFERLVELYLNPIKGNFDVNHLKAIHKYLFNTMYEWAGEYRTVNMEKYNEEYNLTSRFEAVEYIEERLNGELTLMNQDIYKINSINDLACFLAEYYVILLDIHPFREGNGRTIREFLREFVRVKTKEIGLGEMELDWTRVDENKINQYIELARAFRGNIEIEFLNALKLVKLSKGR